MVVSLRISLNKNLYIRNPEQTKLGQDIVSSSIVLINKLGFDKFNFKKLAQSINSNEPSIYRYFESKHQLLKYLIAWYWSWLDYRIDFQTNNINDPDEKLKAVIGVLSESVKYDPSFAHIDEAALAHIVIKESPISYITEDIDQSEIEYVFQSYENLCYKLAQVISNVNPKYSKSKALAISMIKITHEQIFFSRYFSKVTEIKSSVNDNSEVAEFVEEVIFSVLKK